MAGSPDIWKLVQDTRSADNEERETDKTWPLGLAVRERVLWRARGTGETGATYKLNAIEYLTRGLMKSLVAPPPVLAARAVLFKEVRGHENHVVQTFYMLARPIDGRVSVSGEITEFDERDDAPGFARIKADVLAMDDEVALRAFESDMADANFD